MGFLLERDTVNGKEGKAFVTIDGRNHELFGLKKIQADAEIQSEDMTVVGTRRIQQKTTGVKQTGTATIYYGTPLFTDMVLTYIKTGVMPQFDIQITNNDPTTTVGTQIMGYYGCKLTSTIPLSILDADTTMLTIGISFTYTDVAKLQGFSDPAQLGS